MKRRTSRKLSILLALCMVLALLPGTALAADILDSGVMPNNVAWKLYSDGTLDISGEGEILNNIFLWDGFAPWRSTGYRDGYENVIKKIVIHSGITSID